MKKTLKLLAVVALLLIMLVGLTGCGNKIVATKDSEQDGIKYEEKLEIKLKKDKVDTIKMTMKFDDKETAEEMKTQLDYGLSMIAAFSGEDMGIEVKQSGKKITMKLNAEQFASMSGTEIPDVSKEDLKANLEEAGYKVK